jgi:ribosomal protein S2
MKNVENEKINTIPQEIVKMTSNKDKEFLPEGDVELTKSLLEDLMGLGCHFGHPKLAPKAKKLDISLYKLNGCNIINLDKTLESLRTSLKAIFNTVSRGEKILFLTTNENLKAVFKEVAIQCGALYIDVRYQPGTLTNSGHFLEKKKRLEMSINDKDETLTKKEIKVMKNKRKNTEEYFEGLTGFTEAPKLVITVGGEKEYKSIVAEVKAMNIGLITLSDTDVDPVIGYNQTTIYCNVKSSGAIAYIMNLMKAIIFRGYQEYVSNNKNIPAKAEILPQKVTQADIEKKMFDTIVAKSASLAAKDQETEKQISEEKNSDSKKNGETK